MLPNVARSSGRCHGMSKHLYHCRTRDKIQHKLHPSAILTSKVAVVGRHHQQLGVLVLDDVLPVDGVSVAQQLVLVDVNSPVQDLCDGGEDEKRWWRRRRKKRSGDEQHIGRDVRQWQEINTSRLCPIPLSQSTVRIPTREFPGAHPGMKINAIDKCT